MIMFPTASSIFDDFGGIGVSMVMMLYFQNLIVEVLFR
jgi:hypothetical protein